MRVSLKRVRARVERLAGHLRDGCRACRGDAARTKYIWRDHRPGSGRRVADDLAQRPREETCATCGRTYPLRYVVVGWIQDDAVDETLPEQTVTGNQLIP